jgi:hypothetical protein
MDIFYLFSFHLRIIAAHVKEEYQLFKGIKKLSRYLQDYQKPNLYLYRT